jgi:hypothetical protein
MNALNCAHCQTHLDWRVWGVWEDKEDKGDKEDKEDKGELLVSPSALCLLNFDFRLSTFDFFNWSLVTDLSGFPAFGAS